MRAALLALISIMMTAVATPARPDGHGPILVFAAASLKGALDRIAADWQENGGPEVVLSYAATSALARQIEAGAPADIFVAASAEWMDRLATAGLVDAGSRRDLAGNALVLVRHGSGEPPVEIGPDFDLAGALGDGRLAVALVSAVPAGIYARQALGAFGLWDAVADRLAETDNVRAALALVDAGETPLGIVYATDARAEPAVSVVGTFPADSHDPIVYPAALVSGGVEGAAAFLDHLSGSAARAVFVAEGFTVAGK